MEKRASLIQLVGYQRMSQYKSMVAMMKFFAVALFLVLVPLLAWFVYSWILQNLSAITELLSMFVFGILFILVS